MTRDEATPSRVFLVVLAVALLAAAALLVRPFLGAVVLGLTIGYLLHPAYDRLLPLVRRRWIAASVVVLGFAAALVVPLVLIGRRLLAEAGAVTSLAQDERGFEAAAADLLGRVGVPPERASEFAPAAVERASAALQGAAAQLAAQGVHVVASLIVFFFLLFFVLRDGPALVEAVRRFTPLRERSKDRLLALVGRRTRAIVLGTFLVSVLQGVASGIGWWVFGFPAPFFWGFVITLVAVLPFGAPFLILVPASILAIVQGDLWQGIGLLAYSIVVVGLIDDLVRPWVVGRHSGIHPAIVLVGTLGGLVVFGASGFVLGPLLLGLVGPVLEAWADDRER